MTNIVLYDKNRSTVDGFFDARPYESDWIAILAEARYGKLDPAALVTAIKAREPLTPGNPYTHEVWCNQQRLRLALRQQKGLPLVLDRLCAQCAERLQDPVCHVCLWCEERNRQVPRTGSRGNCHFLSPTFDVTTNTWGLLYYDRGNDDRFLLWLAKGYGSLRAAQMALYPIGQYTTWLEQRYNGVYNDCYLLECLFPLSDIITTRTSLPYTPDDFETCLRNNILEHMQFDHGLLGYSIRSALNDYHRQENS